MSTNQKIIEKADMTLADLACGGIVTGKQIGRAHV